LLTSAAVNPIYLLLSCFYTFKNKKTFIKEIIKFLRRAWDQEKIIFRTAIHCDFIISQRCALVKYKWSGKNDKQRLFFYIIDFLHLFLFLKELSSVSSKDQVIEKYARARALYAKIVVLIQDDREANSKFYLILIKL
jgi:hypothetical protein